MTSPDINSNGSPTTTFSNRAWLNNDYDFSDSAIGHFYDLVSNLNNQASDGAGALHFAGQVFEYISRHLNGVNQSLASGWAEVANLLYKTDDKVQSLLSDLILEMNRYAESVASGEQELQRVVNDSNAITNELLNELNGI